MRLLLFILLGCAKQAPEPTPTPLVEADLHGTRPPAPIGLAPFHATAHDGTPRDASALKGKPTVLWFFPAANTSGCTVEGCGYRDRFEAFQKLGVQIIGVSFTDLETNAAWVKKQGFQYEIWRDDDRQLARFYDALRDEESPYPLRRTRILNAEGSVVLEYNDSIIVGAHPQDVLEDVQMLFSR